MIRRTFAQTLLAIAAVVAAAGSAAWGQSFGVEETPISFGAEPGGYAIYRIDGAAGPAYLGVCNTRGNELAIRLYDTVTERELLALQTFYISGSGDFRAVAAGTVSPVRGSFETPLEKKILTIVSDLLGAWDSGRSAFADMPSFSARDGEGTTVFEYWIPVIQLRSTPSMTLVTAGFLSSFEDPAFYGFVEEPASAVASRAPIVPGNPVVASIGGVSVGLDTRWVAGADGLYRFPDANARDACCYVETIDASRFGGMDIFDLIRGYLLYSGGVLIAKDVKIFAIGEDPCAFYRVWDPLTGRQSAQYRLFLPRGESGVSVVCLAAFNEVYDGNEEYFRSILLRTEP